MRNRPLRFKTRYGHLRKVLARGAKRLPPGRPSAAWDRAGAAPHALALRDPLQRQEFNPTKFIEAGDHVYKQQTANDDTWRHR
jgi:hypothetical protein